MLFFKKWYNEINRKLSSLIEESILEGVLIICLEISCINWWMFSVKNSSLYLSTTKNFGVIFIFIVLGNRYYKYSWNTYYKRIKHKERTGKPRVVYR